MKGSPFSDAILPSPANAHHPHLLRREAVVAALSLAILVEALVLGSLVPKTGFLEYTASVLPGALASFTNDARTGDHLAALSWNTKLATAAAAKARDMAQKGYFAHVSPDGTLPWKWIGDSGYRYQYAGENLAVNFSDSEDVVSAWLNSPTHRANILGENYTEIGIGTATGTYKGKETIFVVQYFGKPTAGTPTSIATASHGPSVPPVPAPIVAINAPSDVLGAETASSPIAHAASSVHTTSNKILFGIGLFFTLLLALALVLRKRFPRGAATIGALSVIATALLLVILNEHIIPHGVELPLDTQSASVISTMETH